MRGLVGAVVARPRDNDAQGPSTWTLLPVTTTGSGRVAAALPVTWMTTIPAGQDEAFCPAVFLSVGSLVGVHAEGSLSAVDTPF